MANYVLSCDLNSFGQKPKEIDRQLANKPGWMCARMFDSVWYIGTNASPEAIVQQVRSMLTERDHYAITHLTPEWLNEVMFDRTLLNHAIRANQ